MTQGPEVANAALHALEKGDPLVTMGILGVGALALAALIVSMMKRRDIATANAAAARDATAAKVALEREAAFQDYLRTTAAATQEVAKNSAVMVALLSEVKESAQESSAQMKAWGSRDWLQEDLATLKEGLAVLLEERKARGRR